MESSDIEHIRQEGSKIYAEVISGTKQAKSKLCEIIKTINKDIELRKSLTPEVKTHLTHIIEIWRNHLKKSTENYFNLKDHHMYINGKIENIMLRDMWDDYIEKCCSFRCNIIILNHLYAQLQ